MALLRLAVAIPLGLSVLAQASPVVQRCPGVLNDASVACVNRYASVLPLPFERGFAMNGSDPANDTFVATSVPSDPSFKTLQNASFIVFDQTRGLEILGSSPKLERVFDTRNDSIHEAPVYVPGLNVIIYSLPHQGVYEQQIINLNNTPPTIENYTTTPPVYAVNGGKLYKDRIYWASEASSSFPSPTTNQTIRQAPGIYMLNPYTNETTILLNNYYGTLLNSPNDLFIDSAGDIFFTDSWYGYAINVTSYPRLPPQTYRFRPSTGSLNIVENTLGQPNGIGISPDGRTMYISDSGVTDFSTLPMYTDMIPRYTFNPFGGSALYAYDVGFSPAGNYITGKRPINFAFPYSADGFHVSREGDLVGASGTGLNLYSAYGEMVMRIEIGGDINQCQFAGERRDELWLFGPAGIFRVSGLQGIHGMVEE